MSDKFASREEVACQVQNEGVGYFLMYYTSPESMPDPELELAFREAREAIQRFEALLPDVEY